MWKWIKLCQNILYIQTVTRGCWRSLVDEFCNVTIKFKCLAESVTIHFVTVPSSYNMSDNPGKPVGPSSQQVWV